MPREGPKRIKSLCTGDKHDCCEKCSYLNFIVDDLDWLELF